MLRFFQRKKKRKRPQYAQGGLTPFGYAPHCGPFNSIGLNTKSNIDKLCKSHDEAYNELIKNHGKLNTYLRYNTADEELVNSIQSSLDNTVAGHIAAKIFGLKRLFYGGYTFDKPRKRRKLLEDITEGYDGGAPRAKTLKTDFCSPWPYTKTFKAVTRKRGVLLFSGWANGSSTGVPPNGHIYSSKIKEITGSFKTESGSVQWGNLNHTEIKEYTSFKISSAVLHLLPVVIPTPTSTDVSKAILNQATPPVMYIRTCTNLTSHHAANLSIWNSHASDIVASNYIEAYDDMSMIRYDPTDEYEFTLPLTQETTTATSMTHEKIEPVRQSLLNTQQVDNFSTATRFIEFWVAQNTTPWDIPKPATELSIPAQIILNYELYKKHK